jgi:toxin CptA
MTPARTISVTPSRQLALLLCAMHLAAAGAVSVTPAPPWVRFVLLLAIAASLFHCLARDAVLCAPGAIVALEIGEDGVVSFRTRRGTWFECAVLGSSFVSPRLTIVHLRQSGQRRTRHVILVPDNVEGEDFRRLRVWLRWRALRGGPPG